MSTQNARKKIKLPLSQKYARSGDTIDKMTTDRDRLLKMSQFEVNPLKSPRIMGFYYPRDNIPV